MASLVQCPRCNRRYSVREDMVGKKVSCASCGQNFLVPPRVPASAVRPPPRAVTPPTPSAPAASGLNDLLTEALGVSALPGDPLAGPALDAGTPLAGGLSSYRRRRMSGGDAACLLLGSVLAALDIGCLLVLFPILGVSATAAMVAAIVLGVLGAGLIVFAQRRNLLVALPVGTGICCLLFIGIVIRPLPKPPEQAEAVRKSELVGGTGAKVIGIHGRGAAVLDAIGLVFQ